MQHMFAQSILRREVFGTFRKFSEVFGSFRKFWEVDLKAIQNFFVIFLFVSTLNSMGGVLCSAIVSEWLKMRKSLAIHY